MTDQQRVRIGIIGTGDIAGAHARAYAQLDFVDLVAVTDIVPGRAADFVQRHALLDAVGYDDHHALLASDVDAVSICTPNVSHHALSIDALRAGKQVLVEKPMSVTLDQAIEMVQVANAEERMLSIGFQPRYDPSMERVRELVQSGALGDVYYVETGGGRRRGIPGGTFVRKAISGAGAMADIGCYSLDLALNTLGYPRPVSVSAFTADRFGTNPLYFAEASSFDVEDFGVAMVRFETDLVLQFKISWAMHMDSLGSTMFLGTDAGLKIEPHGTGPWSGVWDGKIGSIRMFHDLLGEPTHTEVPVVEHTKDLFFEKIRAFAEAVRDGGDAPIPGSEILYQQAIIDGVLRSADARREVEIDLRGL